MVCVEIRSLCFSCDLLIVLLLFSLLPIHFYFDKRVDFRSLTTKQDSFRQEELEPDILAQSTWSGSSFRIKDRRSKEKVGAESVRSSAVQRRSHHIRERCLNSTNFLIRMTE